MTNRNDTAPETLSSIKRSSLDATDETILTHDECAAMALRDRVQNSPSLSMLAPVGSWEVAISRALDLFEEPRNISELWCWARFCWAFGRRDTWAANAKLEELLRLVLLISDNATKLALARPVACEEKPFEQKLEYGRLEENATQLAAQLGNLLRDVYQNDQAWNDRADFMAFKGRT